MIDFSNIDLSEFFSKNPHVTEILINGKNQIFYELKGELISYVSPWDTDSQYLQFVRSILDTFNTDLTLDEPFCSGRFDQYRIQIIGPPVSKEPVISIRRLLPHTLKLDDWVNMGGLDPKTAEILKESVKSRDNMIVFGPTGSGKTTLLSSLLSETLPFERVLILEDVEELALPNDASLRLLSRLDTRDVLKEITLTDLIRHSLRMRPDRLALGEVRGPEAKDLLMALATGHKGSFGTIHATSLNEALLRLEMLVQLGAPQWQTQSIRQLIMLSVQTVVEVRKTPNGQRTVASIHRLSGLENFGFLSERLA